MEKAVFLTALLFSSGVAAWSGKASADATAIAAQAASGASQKAGMEAAAKLYQRSCRACHGNRAQGASSYPRLADKDPKAIAAKLKRYRAGEKFGPNSALMIPQAKKLTDQDIANISLYVTTAFD